MGSGARSIGLYDFDGSNTNCVEWHGNTTSWLNTPLGKTTGLGSVLTQDPSGSVGRIKADAGEFTHLLTAHGGLIVESGIATLKDGLMVGPSGSRIPDSRELVQSEHNCGETTTCANTKNGGYREIFGTISLRSGKATLTGIDPEFTSQSTFGCTCTDRTTVSACRAIPISASSVAFAGTNSDVLFYSCIGN